MRKVVLPDKEIEELKELHRRESNRKFADRIKTIILLNKGWSYSRISEILLLDDQTIKNYETKFLEGGIDRLLTYDYKGGISKLTNQQEKELEDHIAQNYYHDSKALIELINLRYGVKYSLSGMVDLLHRLGFVYKRTKIVPAKADPEKQLEFLEKYKQLKSELSTEDKIMFMDGVHPQFNTKVSCCWIRKGKNKEVSAQTGRERININGAVNVESMEVVVREDKTINAESTIALFKQIENRYPPAHVIYIIADNAGYYRSRKVKEYLKKSRIKVIFLPPYSPNLNLIERLWKYFYKKILYDCFYNSFKEFKSAVMGFFEDIEIYKKDLQSLLTEKFQIIGV